MDGSAHFFRNDVGDGGFAQTRRAVKDGMVEWFTAALGGFHAHTERFFHFGLSDVFVQRPWTKGALDGLFFFEEMVVDDTVRHASDVRIQAVWSQMIGFSGIGGHDGRISQSGWAGSSLGQGKFDVDVPPKVVDQKPFFLIVQHGPHDVFIAEIFLSQ